MAFEIPAHFSLDFTTNMELLLQQTRHKLEGSYNMRTYTGEKAQVIKQFGEVEFDEVTVRHQPTQFTDIEHKQRWVLPTDYNKALAIDSEDEIRMLNSPQSEYVRAMVAAWNRKKDSVLRDALLGDAQTGVQGGTTTSFDTSNQQIAADSSGMTIAKLREAHEILLAAENDFDQDRAYIAMSARQKTDLLESTEVTSSDYNIIKALVQGDVDSFMGFTFIDYQNLEVDGSNDRRCPCWMKSGLHMGIWNGLDTHIDQREDLNYLTQVFMKGTIGATRTQENKVVEILCDES